MDNTLKLNVQPKQRVTYLKYYEFDCTPEVVQSTPNFVA
jgi:hypothetical protein